MSEPQSPPAVAQPDAGPQRALPTALLMAASAALGALLTAGGFLLLGGTGSDTPDTFDVAGKAVVRNSYGSCPMLENAKVHVLNEAKVVVAVGKAEAGRYDDTTNICTHRFTVTGVPSGHGAYGVTLLGLGAVPVFYTEPALRGELPLEVEGAYPAGNGG